ncbi:melanoma-associated antigen 8-like isoform X2 [Talpa occidentalis]|nr:melanoma-associated antigen 8-like isoform X2 [Talpa occidentalis]
MSLCQKSELLNLEEDIQEPREDGSFLQVMSEEDASAPSIPPGANSSPRAMAASLCSRSEAGNTSNREAEGPGSSREPAQAQAPPPAALQGKMAALVEFLLLKYRAKEPTSKAEMLREVLGDNQEHFSGIFSEACDCLQLVFGIDVTEAEPNGDTYVLAATLGLSYDGLLSPEQLIPKTGLLVVVLGVILLDGDRASEEHMWEALGAMGVHAGMEHFIFGEPRALLTEAWVQEQYLEYCQVPGSDPARYEFLWGPRALAETSKMDVLDFILKVNRRQRTGFLAF